MREPNLVDDIHRIEEQVSRLRPLAARPGVLGQPLDVLLSRFTEQHLNREANVEFTGLTINVPHRRSNHSRCRGRWPRSKRRRQTPELRDEGASLQSWCTSLRSGSSRLIMLGEGGAAAMESACAHLHTVFQIGRRAAVSVCGLHHAHLQVQVRLGGRERALSTLPTTDFVRMPSFCYLSEQLFEVGADQSRNLVSVQQVKAPLGVCVEVHDPVGVPVEGAGALARVHRHS